MSIEKEPFLRPLILDIGSSTFRLGWTGEDFPDILAPSVYVEISDFIFSSDVIDGLEEIYFSNISDKYLVGHEALKYQNILNVHFFKKENNYNVFPKFFLRYYRSLNIPEEFYFKQPLIIISPFSMTEQDKKRLQEIFFKQLNFPSIYFLSESRAILSTLQKDSGVIVNIGESNTHVSTIFHGYTNAMARENFLISGESMTNYLLNLILLRKSIKKTIYMDELIAKELKEKLSLCVLNPKKEKNRIKEGLTKYDRLVDLPDGIKLKINYERFQISEILFNPKLIHVDFMSLDEIIAKVVKTWEMENWGELLSNIILSGGGSLIPGLNERLRLEVQKHFSEKLKPLIKVISVSGRENMSWIGASILSSKGELKKGWIMNPNLQ